MNDESGESMNRRKKCHSQDNVCVCLLLKAQPAARPLSTLEHDSGFSKPSDYVSTSKHGQSVLFFYPREIVATFTRATLC